MMALAAAAGSRAREKPMRSMIFALGLAAAGNMPVALAATTPVDRLERPAPVQANANEQALNDILSRDQGFVAVGRDGLILNCCTGSGQPTQAATPSSVLLTAVHGQPGQPLWAVGHDGAILRGNSSGEHWQLQFDGRRLNQLLLASAQRQLTAAQQASDAQPEDEQAQQQLDNAQFALDDALASLDAGPARPLLDVWARNAERGWVSGAYGVLLSTEDGGSHWQLLDNLPNPERLHLNSVLEVAPNVLLVAGEGGLLYRSTDAGQHWQAAQQLSDGSLYQLIALKQPGDVLVVGFGGFVARSQDAGEHWQELSTPIKTSLFGGIQLNSGALLLVGHAGNLLYSDDLQRFKRWRDPQPSSWVAATQLADGNLQLAGRKGLQTLPLNQLVEHAQ